MKQNEKEFYYEEDEVSLYDIADFFLKYKKIIISVLLIGFSLSLALALAFRNYNRKEEARQDFSINYGILESTQDYQVIELSYEKFDFNKIFRNENYIDMFLEIPELKEEFEKNKKVEDTMIDKKIKFLSKIIEVKKDKENPHLSLIVTIDKNLKVSEKIVEKFFNILENETSNRLRTLIEKEKEKIISLNKESEKKLEELKVQIAEILKNEKLTNITIANDIPVLVSFKEPRLASENTFYQSIYNKTRRQILGVENTLNGTLIDEIVQRPSSLIITNKSGIAKYILLAGVALTIFIAFLIIMLKEFNEGYKRYKIEKGQRKLIK